MARPRLQSSKLTAEGKLLAQKQAELRREEEALQRTLRQIPSQIERRKSREREMVELRAKTSNPAISLGNARQLRGKQVPRTRQLRGRETHNARTKFLVLCVLLILVVVLLWRAMP